MKLNLATCTALLLAVGLEAQNWPSFRGANASASADGQNPPLVWDAEKSVNILWKTRIPGLAHSSPIVWGDRIYLTSAISSDPKALRLGSEDDPDSADDLFPHSWRVYCLDKKTGRILWERTVREGIPKVKRHPRGSHASATPVTDGKHVVAYFGSEGLYCYDLKGKVLWKQDVGVIDAGWFLDPGFQWGVGSSPIIYKNLVIVQCDRQKDSFIAAYNLQDGKRAWMTSRKESPSWATPTVWESNGRAELVTNAKQMRGYEPLTGRELWTLSPGSYDPIPTPVVAEGLVFLTSGYEGVQPIYAIRPGATGDISLKDNAESNSYIAWSRKRGGPALATPIVYRGYLYTCSENGIVAAYHAGTGERIYRQRVSDKGGACSASPIAADGRLYFTSEDGDIHVVKAGPKFEVLATNRVGEVLLATPAISEGMILVRSQYHVYGIGERKHANLRKP